MSKRLGDLVKIRTGRLNANASIVGGKYPFFTCSEEPLKIDTYSYECECVLIAGNGTLNVKYYNGKFDAYQRTYIIESLDKNVLSVRYLYHFLCSYIDVLRYSSIGGIIKYIKLNYLTDVSINLPTLVEQNKISETIDKLLSIIGKVKQLTDLFNDLAKSQFVDMFDPLTNKYNYPIVNISQISNSYFAGGDKPTVFSKNQIGECIYPVYSNGEDNLGLQGFTNKYRVDKEAVTISARGSIGFSCIREPKFTPIVRLITIIPNDRINIYYLKYLFDYSVVRSNGSSQQQFTIPELKKMSFILAPLDKQDEFASFVEQIDKSKIIIQSGCFA